MPDSIEYASVSDRASFMVDIVVQVILSAERQRRTAKRVIEFVEIP